jgi:hypothetical protein
LRRVARPQVKAQVQELQLTEFLVVLFFSKSFYCATLNGSVSGSGTNQRGMTREKLPEPRFLCSGSGINQWGMRRSWSHVFCAQGSATVPTVVELEPTWAPPNALLDRPNFCCKTRPMGSTVCHGTELASPLENVCLTILLPVTCIRQSTAN